MLTNAMEWKYAEQLKGCDKYDRYKDISGMFVSFVTGHIYMCEDRDYVMSD